MTRFNRTALIGILAGLFTLGLSGCEKDTPAENAAEEIGDAVEDAGDAVEDAADDAKDKVEEAADKIEDKTD